MQGDRSTRSSGLIVGVGWSGTTETLARMAQEFGSGVIDMRGRISDRDMAMGALDQVLGDAGSDVRTAARILSTRLETPGVVLAVDDAHWLDAASLDVLARVVDRGLPVLVAHRPVTGDVHLAQLDEALLRNGDMVEMGPRTVDELAPVVTSALGRPAPSSLIERVWAASAGLPGLARLLIEGWTREGWNGKGDPPPVPSIVVEAVRRRLAESGEIPTRLAEVAGRHAGLPVEALARALGTDGPEVARAWSVLGSAGLAVPGRERLIEVVVEALDRMVLPSTRAVHEEALGRALVETGGSAAVAARLLAGTGAPVPARVRVGAAREMRSSDPAAALAQLRGLAPTGEIDLDRELRVLRAELGLITGDEEAGRWMAEVPEDEPGVDLLRAALAVRDARWSRALSILRAIEEDPIPGPDRLGALALARLANGAGGGPPHDGDTLPLGSAALATVVGGRLALGRLLEAAEAEERSRRGPVLATVHAVGSMLCSAAGELSGAVILASRGARTEVGGPGLVRHHRLAESWVAMRSGDWERAAVPTEPGSPWIMDTMLEAALAAGLARRSGDISRIRDTWDRVEEMILRGTVDLFALEPLTELAIAAHRLGHGDRAARVFAELEGLIAAMGSPPLWVGVLAWRRLEAALAASDDDGVHREAGLLAELGDGVRPLPTLATAARIWSSVLGGSVDPEEVVGAGEALAGEGRSWEGSRLIGRAALVTDRPETARRLLESARRMCATSVAEEATSGGLERLGLSEREIEVAALVADGHTYKAIGGRLFISPKTVEHHVASIRSKLGVGSRAEMLAALRSATGPGAPPNG